MTISSGASISSAAVSRRPRLLELLGQRVGLRHGAREAVEQEAVVALLVDLVEDHRDHQVVGHELAVVHVLLGLLAELGPSRLCSRSRSPVPM